MILTLIVVVVVSILGTALWQYGINSTIQVDKEVKKKQADYIARSGAEAVAIHILQSDGVSVKSYIDSVDGKSSKPANLGGGSFRIRITRDSGKISVESAGTFSGEQSTVSVVLSEKTASGFPSQIFSNVMFSNSAITLNGNVQVSGSLECTGDIYVHGRPKDVSIAEHSTKSYPSVIYPNNPSTDQINVNNWDTMTISGDANYKSIYVKNGGTLNFQMPGHDIRVIADSIHVNGHMTVSGTGRLYLYTKSFFGVGDVNADASSSTSLLVLMPPGGSYDVTCFKGLFYGPGASVKLNGGPTFTGAMIAGKIFNAGNPQIIYDPDAANLQEDLFKDVDLERTESTDYSILKWN